MFKTSLYIGYTEVAGVSACGLVLHNEIITVRVGKRVQGSREELLRRGWKLFEKKISKFLESSNHLIEICVNPADVPLMKEIIPDKYRKLVTSCSYNPAIEVAAEIALGERPET